VTSAPVRPGGGGRRLGSTYRLQVHGLGLAAAAGLVPYLARLGVETLYAAPVLRARPGSTHGYDVVDPTAVDPALGGDAALEELLEALHEHGMGLLVDIVPNHMAATADNPWWWDVLARGRCSPWAAAFDVDWEAQGGRVLLPVLGQPYGAVLESGELSVRTDGDGSAGTGEPLLCYHEHRFPLASGTTEALDGERPLAPDDLERLLDAQHYRLAYWRVAAEEINYRRFFNIDDLVGVRVEDAGTFDATHHRVLALAADPRVRGLRVDHVDGLADPGGYLARLASAAAGAAEERGAGDGGPVVVIEKILARGEQSPPWPVAGTTGYEFADQVSGLFVDPVGAADLDQVADETRTGAGSAGELEVAGRRQVATTMFSGQLERACRGIVAAASLERAGRDVTVAACRRALVALLGHLKVYRTYLADGLRPDDRARLEDAAALAAGELDPDAGWALQVVLRVLHGQPARPTAVDSRGRLAFLLAAMRVEQLASAVAAKGVEDTAFYRYAGLLSAAEVGGSPTTPSLGVAAFHEAMAERRARFPGALNASSTHDSKRAEDLRARLSVLSEVPALWRGAVHRWVRRHRGWLSATPGAPVSPDVALVLYQSIVGAWPLDPAERPGFTERIATFAEKAVREAKRETSWFDPDPAFERAVRTFVERLLTGGDDHFVAEVEDVVRHIGPAACATSLAMVALKCTAPGVPDFYQGTELWAQSLVDPDNRRPVDFGARARGLDGLERAWGEGDADNAARRSLARWEDGTVKLLVTRQLLHLRRRHPDLFDAGSYVPLTVGGPAADHVVAFARHHRRHWVVTVVPRLVLTLAGPATMPTSGPWWEGTTVALPAGAPEGVVDAVTGAGHAVQGGSLAVDLLLRDLPVAVLSSANYHR
jgi:malto-oligosyltrehalose synthase